MPPDGMGLFHVSHAEGFTPAEVPGVVVVKHHVIVQQDHRMARVGSRERLADYHIAGYGLAGGNLTETVGRHVLQVEILSAQPPAFCPGKIRQVNATQVIRIAKSV